MEDDSASTNSRIRPADLHSMESGMESLIKDLPKCELHVHLEGCITPSLAKFLATRNNVPLPESILKAVGKDTDTDTDGGGDSSSSSGGEYAFHDLTSFLAIYYPAMSVLLTRQDFHDLAWDYLTRAARQNVHRAEMFFDPQAHLSRGVEFAVVLDGFWDAVVRAESELGLSAGLIMCILRDHSVESASEVLDLALRPENRSRILGVGLDSDERGNPPIKFKEVFERARRVGGEVGWRLTAHCDIDQENTLVHIRQALVDVRVDRLDHGSNIVDDPELVEFVRDRGIGLTCCPISNSVVTPSFKGEEILNLLRDGVKVTLNSDDPAYFRGYVEENLLKVARETNVNWQEMLRFQRNAFEISWADEEKKREWLGELSEFEERTKGLVE